MDARAEATDQTGQLNLPEELPFDLNEMLERNLPTERHHLRSGCLAGTSADKPGGTALRR